MPVEFRHPDIASTLTQLYDNRTDVEATLQLLALFSGATVDAAQVKLKALYAECEILETKLLQANDAPETTDADFRAIIADALMVYFNALWLRERLHAAFMPNRSKQG